jgi:hypothetical protein
MPQRLLLNTNHEWAKLTMTRFIAFLRAINVGGHNVKMDHLRKLFEALGFPNKIFRRLYKCKKNLPLLNLQYVL